MRADLSQAQPSVQLRRLSGNHESGDGTACLTEPGCFMLTSQAVGRQELNPLQSL
jgi:hypothetical protein